MIDAAFFREKEKWRVILGSIIHCIKSLAVQILPLRGHKEMLVDPDLNGDNFLGLVRLISNFDHQMKEYVDRPQDVKAGPKLWNT